LPGDDVGEIVVRQTENQALTTRIFDYYVDEIPSVVELNVISARPPEKPVAGFSSDNSTLVRFETPQQPFPHPWGMHHLVILSCDKEQEAKSLAITRTWVSNAPAVWLICAAILITAYLLCAVAVWKIRRAPEALADKYKKEYEDVYRPRFVRVLDPVFLTCDVDNRGNIQKLQVLLFSFLVAWMLLSLNLRLGILSQLSTTVAALIGVSAVGAAVGQGAMIRERLRFDNWTWLVRKGVLAVHGRKQQLARWGDLMMTGNQFDIYKLQTLIFSLVVAIALMVGGEAALSTFAVPETLLVILGLSQGVYVAGVVARPPSYKELDDALTKLRKIEANFVTVVSFGVDTDPDGKLPQELPKAPVSERIKAKNASLAYNKLADQVEVMLEVLLERPVDRNLLVAAPEKQAEQPPP
jgi:hypothetical protein